MISWITRNSWKAVSASEVGLSHVRNDVPCQDASKHVVDSETLIACVADGAGSADRSDEGSRRAVDEFVAVSEKLLKQKTAGNLEDIATEAFEEARKAVLKIAEDNPRDFATTLSGLIATRDDIAAVQIGDGAIVIDGEVVLDSYTDMYANSGDYSNETRFLTESDVAPVKFSASKNVARVAILTDGLDNIAFGNNGYERTPHAPFFDPMFAWLESSSEPENQTELAGFLTSDRVRAKTGDDVTLLLAMR